MAVRADPCVPHQVLPFSPNLGFRLQQDKGHCSGENSWATDNVSVREVNGKVIFLRKLVRGGSEHSFGIHVAKLAGMPASIIDRANHILADLEGANSQELKAKSHIGESREGMQLSFFQLDDPILEQIRDEVTSLDINNLTPLEALNKLSDIKRLVGGK